MPNTSVTSPTAQLSTAKTTLQLLATPFSAPQPPAIGSPTSPEEDLATALADLAAAPDAPAASAARDRAIAILNGTSTGDVYSGIPLLNAGADAKIKNVPAGGTVTVNIVRFGEHEISDTWLLNFADPNLPFTIEYHVTELDGSEGGDFNPTPLLVDGATSIGGLHSVVVPLVVDESGIGTDQSSRFTTARGLGAQPEHTRLATQKLSVKMPPPKNVSAILDPNLRPDHEALSVLRPAGSVTTVGLGELAAQAPEVQLNADLAALNPLAPDFLTQAHGVGTNDAGLVGTMRVKSHLPPGVTPDPSADVTIAFLNNEVYVSRLSARVGSSSPMSVAVRNLDGFTHTASGVTIKNVDPVFGATNWGEFDWEPAGTPIAVGAGASATLTFSPSSNATQLVIGDPNSGDQAHASITLDRGPVHESFKVPGPAFAHPLHDALDAQGNVWLTLAGADKIARLTPASKLSESTYVEFNLPVPPNAPVGADAFFGPLDIQVDKDGIVWATLPVGNAIARLDPALAHPGTSDGIEIIPLEDCLATECRVPPPPVVPGAPLTREPTQMALKTAADGRTEVWFTELLADKIGVVKRLGPGSYQQNHFTCACKVGAVGSPEVMAGSPSGLDVDASGDLWFTSANKNTVAKFTPPADPFSTTVATIRHYNIPSGALQNEPDIGGAFVTSIPHSVAIDPDGRVWFTELAMARVGYLEPNQAVAGTTQGMHEIVIGQNDFGADVQPADLVSDAAGSIFVTDEYGDQITMVQPSGVKRHWRPTERVSLTDQPMVDGQGNLWFVEAGANLVTRLKGVASTQGGSTPPPSSPPTSPPPGTPPAGGTGDKALQIACATRKWTFGSLAKPRVLLLGSKAAEVTKCIGKPSKKTGATWRYGNRIQVVFKSGKVSAFTLLNGAFRSAPGNVGVGTKVASLKRLSNARVLKRSATRYTTVLSHTATTNAEVVYTVARGKVTRIVVTMKKR